MQEMLRWGLVLLLCLCTPPAAFAVGPPVVAEDDAALPLVAPPKISPRPLASALSAMRAGRWDTARRLAERDGPAASRMIEWYYLLAGLGSLRQVADFLDANPDWPSQAYLRKQAEQEIDEATGEEVLALFAEHEPQTGKGVLALARALIADGQTGEAEASLILAWLSFDLTTQEHTTFIARHGDLLKPHHAERLKMAVWRGLKDVELMLPLVSEQERELVRVGRLAKNGGTAFKEALEALPESLQNDPYVAYQTFNRLVKSDEDAAIRLILKQSRIENGLGQPDKWASWRRALARSKMRAGEPDLAYDLASVHQMLDGSGYSDLEWLSGYLALTYLEEPELALDHFQRFRAAVETPISLGRAGYWIGRAQEALGDTEAAMVAYAEGAAYQTSFYGLLAAERAGLPIDPLLAGTETFAPVDLSGSTAVEAMVLAAAMGDLNKAERFVVHLGQTLDRNALGQVGAILAEMEQPHLQVMLGKAAARRGIVLHAPYYALHPLAKMDLAAPPELSLAIARRESEFDPVVVSGAGAQGLMQVMPGTARDVARDLSLDHEPSRVLNDWEYNAVLGSTYLAQLADRFDGNIIMISAGYNAGPARPPRWMKSFGDPRGVWDDDSNVVDWIEHIPFRETRNYVMRVSESLPIYRARLGLDPLPVPFSEELTGSSIQLAVVAPGE